MIDSRKIEDLHPKVADLCREFIDACGKAGIKVMIFSTLRDVEYQNALYAKGRTAPGSIVTKAKGGQSIHQFACAFDFVPLDAKGKADWGNTKAYEACGKIAQQVGLEWGGTWKFKDMPHCQFTNGLTLADFQAGKQI